MENNQFIKNALDKTRNEIIREYNIALSEVLNSNSISNIQKAIWLFYIRSEEHITGYIPRKYLERPTLYYKIYDYREKYCNYLKNKLIYRVLSFNINLNNELFERDNLALFR